MIESWGATAKCVTGRDIEDEKNRRARACLKALNLRDLSWKNLGESHWAKRMRKERDELIYKLLSEGSSQEAN